MKIKKKDLKVLIERLLFNNDKNSLNEMVQPNMFNALAISYMVASTPASQYEKLALHVAAFVKVNLKQIISTLGVSLNEQQIKDRKTNINKSKIEKHEMKKITHNDKKRNKI